MNALERVKAMAVKAEAFKYPNGFQEDFMVVVKHYQCTPDEIQIMKSLAKHDIGNAVVSYRSMVEEIT